MDNYSSIPPLLLQIIFSRGRYYRLLVQCFDGKSSEAVLYKHSTMNYEKAKQAFAVLEREKQVQQKRLYFALQQKSKLEKENNQ